MDWFKIGKGVCQDWIPSPHLFNSYADYIMQSARMDEAQAGFKIAGRNINNLKDADDTTLIGRKWRGIKEPLYEGGIEWKSGLKLNLQKTKIMVSCFITSWQIHGETMKTVRDFIFLDSKFTSDGDCSHEIKIHLLLERKA